MIFFGSFIIRFSGFGFIVEVSDDSVCSLCPYLRLPFFIAFLPGYAVVFGVSTLLLYVWFVDAVLGFGGGS
jgi:disulfide bond formation protein DsbB